MTQHRKPPRQLKKRAADGDVSTLSTDPTNTDATPDETAETSTGNDFVTTAGDYTASTDATGTATTSTPQLTSPCCQACQRGSTGSWNQSVTQVQDEIARLQKELTLDKTNLSATVRRKTSAEDSRPSAQATGLVGVVLMATVAGLIIVLDLRAWVSGRV
ncbi:hypothetical protein BaRGS_00032058 [Batillaria attramentaria]|uniref:Uncharacterized protein n=1 Tax=Batillaria attramentaria TaxID=370345 RepID=A0ABD0JNQ8_9CAEN